MGDSSRQLQRYKITSFTLTTSQVIGLSLGPESRHDWFNSIPALKFEAFANHEASLGRD
jgi:hypothetical protein